LSQSPSADSLQLAADDFVTAVDRVFDDLQRAIVEGGIAAGSKISEPELAKTYGVSRSTLREAIGRLEACGLVIRKPNVGARVVTLSTEQLLEITQIREPLEGTACRLAAQAMSQAEIDELRQLLVLHMENEALQEGRAYYQKEGDMDFHFRIVKGSGNSKLIELLCEDLYPLVRMYRYQFGMPSSRASKAFDEHSRIIDAIEERDGELAEYLMRRHIKVSRLNIERRLQEAAAEE